MSVKEACDGDPDVISNHMAAIAIRNLPDAVHEALRQRAAERQISLEGLVRMILAEAVAGQADAVSPTVSGFAEVSLPWGAPQLSPGADPTRDLWGALKGSVHVPGNADLTAPLGEAWHAET